MSVFKPTDLMAIFQSNAEWVRVQGHRPRSQSFEALIILFVVIPVIVIGIIVAFVAFGK